MTLSADVISIEPINYADPRFNIKRTVSDRALRDNGSRFCLALAAYNDGNTLELLLKNEFHKLSPL